MSPVVVRRSAVRMWGLALGGVALLVVGLDIVTTRRLGDAIRAFAFQPEDTQAFEPRDVVWAVALLVVGGALAVWGIKELFSPATVLRADGSGLALGIAGPFRRPVRLGWEDVDDIGVARITDEGGKVPAVWVRVFDPGLLPVDPWGARWVDDQTVAVFAEGWDRPPADVVAAVGEIAVAAAAASGDAGE